MEAYPDAKVLLNVRNPETWYTSVCNTIYRGVKMTNGPVLSIFMNLVGKKDMSDMVNKMNEYVKPGQHQCEL